MSERSYSAAQRLRQLRNHRGCINRAYYAAFSAATSEVRRITTEFPSGYEHPPHVQMGRYIKRYLTRFDKAERDSLRDAMERLRQARHEADYRQDAELCDDETRRAILDARYVLATLGVL